MATSTEEIIDGFAGQAMLGILTNSDLLKAVMKAGGKARTYDEALGTIAKKAYDLAAAMMLERGERRKLEPEFSFKSGKAKL